MKCLYACGRSKRRTTDQTAPTGAAIACTTAEQHCPARAACSWCRATSAGTAAHDGPCDAAFPTPPQPAIRLCCCGNGLGAVYGIAAACCLLAPLLDAPYSAPTVLGFSSEEQRPPAGRG